VLVGLADDAQDPLTGEAGRTVPSGGAQAARQPRAGGFGMPKINSPGEAGTIFVLTG
jgi:hypothetical protein